MSVSGGVHLVSSNNLHGIPVKKNILPPFFSRDFLLRSKCPLYFQPLARVPISLTCKADSLNNDRRSPDFPKDDYQGPPPPNDNSENYQDTEDLLETNQVLSSENGRSTTNPSIASKSANEEMLLLFKNIGKLLGVTEKRPVNNQSYGLNATLQNLSEEEREAIGFVHSQLKRSNAIVKKSSNSNSVKGSINIPGKSLEYDESGREDSNNENINSGSNGKNTKDTINNLGKSLEYDESGSEDNECENINGVSDSEDDVPDMLDFEPVPTTSPRPASSFLRESPVPEHEMIMPTHGGDTQMLREEEKFGSEPLFYESESKSGAEKSDGPHAEEKVVNLATLKLPELREMAKLRGLKGYSKLKKAELVKQLTTS